MGKDQDRGKSDYRKYVLVISSGLYILMKRIGCLSLEDVTWLFQPRPKKSLVQLFHALHKSIDVAFAMPLVSLSHCYISVYLSLVLYATVSILT